LTLRPKKPKEGICMETTQISPSDLIQTNPKFFDHLEPKASDAAAILITELCQQCLNRWVKIEVTLFEEEWQGNNESHYERSAMQILRGFQKAGLITFDDEFETFGITHNFVTRYEKIDPNRENEGVDIGPRDKILD